MRRVAVTILLAGSGFATNVFPQPHSRYPDWIKLKGAESMRCIIRRQGPDRVEIETPMGSIQTVERKDVEWLQKEFPPPEQPSVIRIKPPAH